jgi:hypothetical protein
MPEKMDDFLKSLHELKQTLVDLQSKTDDLLRTAPREEIKKTFRDKTVEELEAAMEYYNRFQNYEVCQAIKEVIDEKQLPAQDEPQNT